MIHVQKVLASVALLCLLGQQGERLHNRMAPTTERGQVFYAVVLGVNPPLNMMDDQADRGWAPGAMVAVTLKHFQSPPLPCDPRQADARFRHWPASKVGRAGASSATVFPPHSQALPDVKWRAAFGARHVCPARSRVATPRAILTRSALGQDAIPIRFEVEPLVAVGTCARLTGSRFPCARLRLVRANPRAVTAGPTLLEGLREGEILMALRADSGHHFSAPTHSEIYRLDRV